MTCPRTDAIIGFLEGELSVNQHRDFDEHLQRCAICAAERAVIERLTKRIAPEQGEFEDEAFVADVMRRVADAPAAAAAPRRWWGFRLSFAIPALGAAAALIVAALLWGPLARGPGSAGQPDDPSFLARGGDAPKLDRWVSLWAFRKRGDIGGYQQVDDELAADTSLAFGYHNVRGTYAYLMVFAFDGAGHVYWYHPAYERAGTDPTSVPIEAGRHELREEIQHDLQAGPLRMMGLFSNTPLRVSTIERLVQRALRSRKALGSVVSLALPDTGQTTRLLRVRARSGARAPSPDVKAP